jgi:hypothetical protein
MSRALSRGQRVHRNCASALVPPANGEIAGKSPLLKLRFTEDTIKTQCIMNLAPSEKHFQSRRTLICANFQCITAFELTSGTRNDPLWIDLSELARAPSRSHCSLRHCARPPSTRRPEGRSPYLNLADVSLYGEAGEKVTSLCGRRQELFVLIRLWREASGVLKRDCSPVLVRIAMPSATRRRPRSDLHPSCRPRRSDARGST